MHLIGHRGAREEAPENTLYGFEHLRKLNIHRVEFDVRLNKDKELVVIHDESLDRTTDTQGLIKDFTTQELKAVNACAQFSQSVAAEGVPSLREVLQQWPDLLHAQIEVKPPEIEDHQIICEQIQSLLFELGLQKQCMITSSDIAFLESCKTFASDITRGYIYYDLEKKPIETCLETEAGLLAIHWKLCYQELIEQAHEAGLEVSAWTVNKEKAFLRLKSWGIDSIISDYPSTLAHLVDA